MRKSKNIQTFRIKKFIKNIENGGVIIGYWTGLSFPKFKIHRIISIRNRSNKFFASWIRQLFNVRQGKDRRCEYAYPLWLMAVKVTAYLIYANYFQKRKNTLQVIGDWHSHSTTAKMSSEDIYSANMRLNKVDKTLVGIMYNKELTIYLFEKKQNLQTKQ